MQSWRRHISGALVALVSSAAFAQYTAIVLPTPPGHLWAVARGSASNVTGGYSVPNGSIGVGDDRAILWFKTQPVDVTPPQYFAARILNSREGSHVGNATAGRYQPPLAYLWNNQGAGTLLHPSGFTSSLALGVGGGKQVGQFVLSSMCFECGYFVERHAALWAGSEASLVRMHAPGFDDARPIDTDGTQHVGSGYLPQLGQYRALLWLNPNSPLNLHPAQFDSSFVHGVEGNSQVGWAEQDGAMHALLWRGAASSVVDLHPAGYELSIANSVAGPVQVGQGRPILAYPDRALAWRGTAASVIDLHRLLPVGFRNNHSVAEDIDRNGVIVGTCIEDATGLTRGVIWVPFTGSRM